MGFCFLNLSGYWQIKLRASRYPIVHWPMGWTSFYYAIAKGSFGAGPSRSQAHGRPWFS